MEDIKFYVSKLGSILEKLEIENNGYLKHYLTHRLHVYLNKIYDQIELTIPYVDGEETEEEDDEIDSLD